MIGILITFVFLSIISVALYAILSQDITQSVMLFMAVGLGCVVLFFIFQAPDVALTEAVIGTGLSTAVLLLGIRHTSTNEQEGES
ncbi:Na(+)/H(+) antiporter subunit B [Sulfurospirillum sp. 1612]|uniref:Na(+)/H(+) antiporter subunit B n=1 Tax=Sulfurospirillum sp. 1612 TaxID=3094835 RepID=UPI002F92EEEE